MRTHRAPCIGTLILLCLLLLGAGLLLAENGRDFAGVYMLGEVTDLGDYVRVPLTVRVTNYSGADVVAATITLEDSILPGESYGDFLPAVDIPYRESARVSGSFVIPRREYERWQTGPSPQLRIEFKNAKGEAVRRMIELAPMPMGEEEE